MGVFVLKKRSWTKMNLLHRKNLLHLRVLPRMRKQMGLTEGAPRMPAWSGTLSESDVEAVLAYIKTFWTPEQLRTQQAGPMMP